MKTEIIVALVAAGVSLLLGIINFFSTRSIAYRQNTIELYKVRTELLVGKESKLESAKTMIIQANVASTVADNTDPQTAFPMFLKKAQAIQSISYTISHLIDEETVKNLNEALAAIDNFNLNALNENKPVTVQVMIPLFETLTKSVENVNYQIDKELRQIDSERTSMLQKF